jgi:hypothetical protein
MNTDVCIMCEMLQQWTYREQNVACLLLTNYSYHIRKILLLVFCWMPVPLHNNIYVQHLEYQRKNEAGHLGEFGLNLISGRVRALAWIFLSTQNFGNEIWQKKKWRKIVQILGFLNLALWNTYVKRKNKMCTLSIMIVLFFIFCDMYRTSNFSFCQNGPCIVPVLQFVRYAMLKRGQRKFTYHLFSWIHGIKTSMLLIIVLGLIAKLDIDLCD